MLFASSIFYSLIFSKHLHSVIIYISINYVLFLHNAIKYKSTLNNISNIEFSYL